MTQEEINELCDLYQKMGYELAVNRKNMWTRTINGIEFIPVTQTKSGIMDKSKQKLIKLNESHFIIVDDSEIKEGDFFYLESHTVMDIKVDSGIFQRRISKNNPELFDEFINGIYVDIYGEKMQANCQLKFCKKITHSTQPLEKVSLDVQMVTSANEIEFIDIKPPSLSEIEELIYGYSVEKLYDECDDSHSLESYANGFKKAMELTKDKLLIKDEFELGNIIRLAYLKHGNNSWVSIAKEAIQSMLPPTQWRVKFNEQGKLELV